MRLVVRCTENRLTGVNGHGVVRQFPERDTQRLIGILVCGAGADLNELLRRQAVRQGVAVLLVFLGVRRIQRSEEVKDRLQCPDLLARLRSQPPAWQRSAGNDGPKDHMANVHLYSYCYWICLYGTLEAGRLATASPLCRPDQPRCAVLGIG